MSDSDTQDQPQPGPAAKRPKRYLTWLQSAQPRVPRSTAHRLDHEDFEILNKVADSKEVRPIPCIANCAICLSHLF